MNNSIKNNTCTIDVVIPVYNGEKFILKAVQSVAIQTLQPNKIIIVDDGSTDSTNDIVSRYAKDSKIKIEIIYQENKGLSASRNTGIQNSTGEFLAFLDADDEWSPDKLEEQIAVFNQHTFENLGVVYCQYELIDENSIILKKDTLQIDQRIRGMIFEKLLPANKIISSGSGVLIKKECFEKVGYFDENLKACEDWDMWLRISEHYAFDYSEKVLVKIRQHGENMQKNKDFMLMNHITFFNKWSVLLKTDLVPKKQWSEHILSLILSTYPYMRRSMRVVKNKLTKQCSTLLFSRNNSLLKKAFFVFFIKKIFFKVFLMMKK